MSLDIPAYVIACDDTPEMQKRRDHALKHLEPLGVKQWRGIHGRTWGLATTHTYDEDNPGTGYTISPGHVALNISHVMLWQHCLVNGYKDVLVFEDDAYVKNWERLFEAIKACRELDNVDLVYLGWIKEGHPRKLTKCGDWFASFEIRDGPPYGTHAMYIRSGGLRHLRETNQIAWAHIDTQIWKRSLAGINFLVCDPPLVDQFSQTGEWDGSAR